MKDITLQIPFNLYGKIATLAAAANMPLDGFVVKTADATFPSAPPAPAEK